MAKEAKARKFGSKTRRPVSDKKTKVLSGRIMQSRVQELKQLYPSDMTESEIINDLIKEKLARAQFDTWMRGLKENFCLSDVDLESFR